MTTAKGKLVREIIDGADKFIKKKVILEALVRIRLRLIEPFLISS